MYSVSGRFLECPRCINTLIQLPSAERSEKFKVALSSTESMVSVVQIPTKETLDHIQRIQTITIAWMCVEAALSLWTAWMARSPALLAFGGDSTIELLSAVVVLWRFRAPAQERSEKQVARIAGALLFTLAAYVTVVSAMTLLGHREARTTYLGIAILIGAAAIMPWLAK